MNNSICIVRSDGFCDYASKWFDIEDLEDVSYEELCKDMDLVSDDQYLVVADAEGALAKELLKDTNTDIINDVVEIMDYINSIHMDVNTASELLDAGVSYNELDSVECVGSSMEDYVEEVIDLWGIPENARFYIDRELLERDLNIEYTFYETTNHGLWMYI